MASFKKENARCDRFEGATKPYTIALELIVELCFDLFQQKLEAVRLALNGWHFKHRSQLMAKLDVDRGPTAQSSVGRLEPA